MLFVPTPSCSLKDILAHYVVTVSPQKRSYKTEIYRIKAITFLLGDLALGEVTPMHVVAFRDKRLSTPHPRNPEKTLATSTVKLELMLLSHVYSTAITEWGMESLTNPVLKVRKPKAPPGRSRRLTSREETCILRAALRHSNYEFYAIIVLALQTAMRQGEILGLLWENISWAKRTAFLPMTKNGDVREVPLSCAAYDVLKKHMTPRPAGRVFSYSTHGFKSSWRVFIISLGIKDFHFHDCRHTCISSLLERGLNSMEVAAISGHKSMAMLKRYAHLSASKLVSKLDPKPRAKKYRPVLKDHLPAYPALVIQRCRRVDIDFPDFMDLRVSGRDEQDAIEQARAALLRTVVGMLCEGFDPPMPSSVDTIDIPCLQSKVAMISPL